MRLFYRYMCRQVLLLINSVRLSRTFLKHIAPLVFHRLRSAKNHFQNFCDICAFVSYRHLSVLTYLPSQCRFFSLTRIQHSIEKVRI